LIGTSGTELWHILIVYIMCPCDLDFLTTKLLRDATLVATYVASFKYMDTTYLSRVRITKNFQLTANSVPIFTFWGQKCGIISIHVSNSPKRNFLAGATYDYVLSLGMCTKMRPVGVMKKEKDRNFRASH